MIIDKIKKIATSFPEKNAIIYEDHHITYSQFDKITNNLAKGLLRAGIKQGDRIALMMPNLPHFVFCYYAILKIGAVFVPVNFTLSNEDLHHIFEISAPKAIIYWDGFRNSVKAYSDNNSTIDIVLGNRGKSDAFNLIQLLSESNANFTPHDWQPEDTVALHFTSGITDMPNAAEFTYEAFEINIKNNLDFFRFIEADVFGAILPLYYIQAQTFILNSAMYTGASVVLHSKIDFLEIIKSIDKYKISILTATPNIYKSFATYQSNSFSGASLRNCLSISSLLSDEVESEFEKKLGIPIINSYSITEANGITVSHHPSLERPENTFGIELPGVDLQIINSTTGETLDANEIGEIIVRGKALFKGYWNNPELTEQRVKNGWFHTGDIGKKNENGYVHLISRKNDVIIKSGFQIFTSEIEKVLLKHPKIKEAAVISIPHPDHKEDVQACVVLKISQQIKSEEIIEYCKNHIPVYKCPQVVKFYSSLPKNKMGKIIKRKLMKKEN